MAPKTKDLQELCTLRPACRPGEVRARQSVCRQQDQAFANGAGGGDAGKATQKIASQDPERHAGAHQEVENGDTSNPGGPVEEYAARNRRGSEQNS